MTNREVIDRLEGLRLLIEPDAADRAEIRTLEKKCKQQPQPVASDALTDAELDPDPECRAARLVMIANELYREEKRRDERIACNGQRAYDKRRKEMNSFGLRH